MPNLLVSAADSVLKDTILLPKILKHVWEQHTPDLSGDFETNVEAWALYASVSKTWLKVFQSLPVAVSMTKGCGSGPFPSLVNGSVKVRLTVLKAMCAILG